MACVYCRAEADSREHWIPRGLGAFRGFTPLMNRLCNACNGQLGRDVDEEFMRTGEIGFQRALYGVRGRREHNQVNPFQYRAMSAQQPTTMLTRIPQFDHPILMEGYRNDQGNPAARPLRQVVVRTPEGRIECIPFPRAWTAEQLRKTLEMHYGPELFEFGDRPVLDELIAGDDRHRGARARWHRAQATEKGESVDQRHAQIQEHRIERAGAGQAQPRLPVERRCPRRTPRVGASGQN